MASDSKKTISFSVDSQEQKEAIETFAKHKGMTGPQLARVALYQYIRRYPDAGGFDPLAVQPVANKVVQN